LLTKLVQFISAERSNLVLFINDPGSVGVEDCPCFTSVPARQYLHNVRTSHAIEADNIIELYQRLAA
jgi:hypothetical protein